MLGLRVSCFPQSGNLEPQQPPFCKAGTHDEGRLGLPKTSPKTSFKPASAAPRLALASKGNAKLFLSSSATLGSALPIPFVGLYGAGQIYAQKCLGIMIKSSCAVQWRGGLLRSFLTYCRLMPSLAMETFSIVSLPRTATAR